MAHSEAALSDIASVGLRIASIAAIASSVYCGHASGADPGEVAPAYFTVDERVLTLTDEKGEPIKDIKPYTLRDGDDPRRLAGHFAWKHLKESRSDFNRRLEYPRLGIS